MTSTSTVLEDGLRYHEGDILICKENMKLKEVNNDVMTGLYPNYTYKIKQINKDDIVLVDVLGDEQFNVSNWCIMNDFTLKYCNTVHSAQGDTIKGKFVIADLFSQHEGITKEWLYTAVTRAADLNDIYFLAQSLYHENIQERAMEMVRRYKEQDRKSGRPVVEELYVTPSWIVSGYKRCSKCRLCGEHMCFEKGNPKVVTVNRICNQVGHETNNSELLCKECNTNLGNR
jgi:hypothetical protein